MDIRPNRYAGGGGRRKQSLSLTHLNHRNQKKQLKIQLCDKILNAFKKKKNGIVKFRELYKLYEELNLADAITREYYPKFEECVPESIRPSKIIAQPSNDGTLTIDEKIGIITLRSLIAGLGYHSAPLVRYAKAHHLDESDPYYIKDDQSSDGKKTCAVFRVKGTDSGGSLGLIPWTHMAIVVALERGFIQLAGMGKVEFEHPEKINMIDWAAYQWPELMKGD